MSHRNSALRIVAALSLVSIACPEAGAFPIRRPAVPHATARKTTKSKPQDPLQLAVTDLQTAEKDVAKKDFTTAMKFAKAATEIVTYQRQLVKDVDGEANKVRSAALKTALTDLKDARQQIAAKKLDEAKDALKVAIDELKELIGDKAKAKTEKKAEVKKKD